MSTRTVHTPFHAGDLISKRTARRDTPSPAGEAKILRRWSVAALIASAPRSRVVA